MQLLRVGKKVWTVLAVVDRRGACAVLDLLDSQGSPGERLLADLQETIPERGPPRNNPEASKPLRDQIFELREPTTRGGTLRVLYFYDKGFVIVCANACLKKKNKTPDELIDAAVEIRKEYFEAKAKSRLIIEPLETDDD